MPCPESWNVIHAHSRFFDPDHLSLGYCDCSETLPCGSGFKNELIAAGAYSIAGNRSLEYRLHTAHLCTLQKTQDQGGNRDASQWFTARSVSI